MTVYVNEFQGVAGLFREPAIKSPLASYSISSASTANFPGAGVSYVTLSADAGSLVNLWSSSSGLTLTSSNAMRLAGALPPIPFAVSTLYRIQAAGT